ncbi:MAG: hypothetical protein ACPGVT_00455 [Maricaulaceae bacterium]
MKLKNLAAPMIALAVLAPSTFVPDANALSCMRPDVIRALEDAKASEKLYHVVLGQFISLNPYPVKPPVTDNANASRPPKITRAYFEGRALTRNPHRDQRLTRFPVDIETRCAGPWCSSPPNNDSKQVAFIEARPGDVPILRIGPCPQWTFSAEPKRVQLVRDCLDKTCEPEAMDY